MSELKKILNFYEEVTHARLRKACQDRNAQVYAKLRLADIFQIKRSGVSNEQYRFALQSHFDFVIADSDQTPLFAVEFDGDQHKTKVQTRRDALKNELCDHFQFPLLRINARYLFNNYRHMDLLTWFVEVWFLNQAFVEAQEKGYIPLDEPFMSGSVITIPGRKGDFPLSLSLDARAEMMRLYHAGKCHQPVPSSAVGMDSNGNYRAIAYILTDARRGIISETAMHNQRFPILHAVEVLEEVVVLELFEKLKVTLSGYGKTVPTDAINSRCKAFSSQVSIMAAGGYGEGPLMAHLKF